MNLFKTSLFLLLILLLSGSSCAIQSSDTTISREVKNLTVFSRIYGYVKYFHPSDEAREIDWDRLAVLGVKKVKTDEELKKTLEALFLPIAPTIAFTKTKPDSNAFLSTYLERIGGDTTGLKTVAWQHLGVDMNHESQVYASSRTNRKDMVSDRHFFLYQNIDAQDLPEATVRLRAMIKATFKNQASEGELTLRIDNGNSQSLQTVNQTIRSTAPDAWKRYMVQAELDSSVSQIMIGASLKGDGKLWIDNIQLEAKDNEGNWAVVSLENASFEDHKSRPVGWKARVTGNYDFALVSDNAVNGKCFYMGSEDFLFQRYPKVGETAIQPLAIGLWSEVPLALYSSEAHTLPRSSQTDFNRLKKELETINLPPATGHNENVWLADIIVAWNELQHFYSYFEVIDTDWEAQLSISLEKALTDDTQKEFNTTLSRMLASTRDGHIILRHPSISNSSDAGLPFLVDWIDNKVVVTHSLHEEVQPGDIITSLDGEPATNIVQDQRNQISGSPQLSLYLSMRLFGTGESGTEATVEIKGEEGVESHTIPRSSRRSNSKMKKKNLPVTGQIGDGIYYVDLTRAPMNRINEEMDQIAASPGVIFDLRGYPTTRKVIRHLLTQPDTSNQLFQIPKIIYPDQQNIVGYEKSGWHLTPATPHIQGDVVFITDARAISAAESFMSFIEHYDLGEIVGQPTAGTNGNVNTMTLPGGYKFGWTGMKVVKHDGSQHHMIGIQPTIPAEKTIQGVREGKDELLEKAIEILQ